MNIEDIKRLGRDKGGLAFPPEGAPPSRERLSDGVTQPVVYRVETTGRQGCLPVLAKMGTFFALVILFVVAASSCTVLDFRCSSGEFGPEASVVYGVKDALDTRVLEGLSRLCSAEVEEDA